MKNNWSNSEAKKYIKKYKKLGHSKDMALRVYTTRLLGRNSELVLHGGGNTSVKTSIKDIDGKNYDVLCVKGSGWDLMDFFSLFGWHSFSQACLDYLDYFLENSIKIKKYLLVVFCHFLVCSFGILETIILPI